MLLVQTVTKSEIALMVYYIFSINDKGKNLKEKTFNSFLPFPFAINI